MCVLVDEIQTESKKSFLFPFNIIHTFPGIRSLRVLQTKYDFGSLCLTQTISSHNRYGNVCFQLCIRCSFAGKETTYLASLLVAKSFLLRTARTRHLVVGALGEGSSSHPLCSSVNYKLHKKSVRITDTILFPNTMFSGYGWAVFFLKKLTNKSPYVELIHLTVSCSYPKEHTTIQTE